MRPCIGVNYMTMWTFHGSIVMELKLTTHRPSTGGFCGSDFITLCPGEGPESTPSSVLTEEIIMIP